MKIGLAVALAAFVFSKIRPGDLQALWQRFLPFWLLGCALAFLAGIWALAHRYWVLIGKAVNFRQILGLVIIQTVVGNVIATGAGATSYIALLRSKYQVRVSEAIFSLLIARLADALVLCLAVAVSSWVLWPEIRPLHWLITVLVASLVTLLLLAAAVLIWRHRIVAWVDGILHPLHLTRIPGVERLHKSLASLADQEFLRTPGLLGILLALSVSGFLFAYIFSYCGVQLFAVPVGPWPILFMLSLVQLLAIVPIQVFGGLGVYDLTSLYLYGLFGIGESEMASIILGWRVIFYALNLLLLLYFPLLMLLPSRKGGPPGSN